MHEECGRVRGGLSNAHVQSIGHVEHFMGIWCERSEIWTCPISCGCVTPAVMVHYSWVKKDRCSYVAQQCSQQINASVYRICEGLGRHESYIWMATGCHTCHVRIIHHSFDWQTFEQYWVGANFRFFRSKAWWGSHDSHSTSTMQSHSTIFPDRICLSLLPWMFMLCMMLTQLTHFLWKYTTLTWG